jgi:hypothetical protein
MIMFTVKLKNNQTVEVPFDELETFLEQNRDRIVVQQKTMMGKRVPSSHSDVLKL